MAGGLQQAQYSLGTASCWHSCAISTSGASTVSGKVRAYGDDSTAQCWHALEASEWSENWHRARVEPKQDCEIKNKKYPVPLMITLIAVQNNTKEALLINAGSQAARSGSEQQAQEGWVLQGWNGCHRSVSLHKHRVGSSLPARWLVSGLSTSWDEESIHLAKLFSLFLYTIPHQTPFLGCFPKCEIWCKAQKRLEWVGWL